MAKKNALKDVDPVAITICKQGANRQRIFLRKSHEESDLLALPHEAQRLVKAADVGGGWTTFYCVVAEPGAEEDPGQTGDGTDVWLDADEIRKAAHRLLKNKAYVNVVHDGLAEEGLTIVENAVAPADFEVTGPDGETATIKKNSWYVAIECNEEAVAAVEAGDITGVSLEGTGIRVPLEKATEEKGHKLKCPKCDKVQSASNEECASCGHDLSEARKAKFAQLKKTLSFAEAIGGKELQDSLWRAWSTLESIIWDAFRDEEVDNPKAVIKQALGEFHAYLLDKLEAGDAASTDRLAKIVGTLEGTTTEEDADMGLTEDFAELKKNTEEKLGVVDDLKKESEATTAAVTGLVDLTGKLVDRVEALAAKPASEEDGGDGGKKPLKKMEEVVEAIGKVADRMDEQDAELQNIAKSVRKLGEGGSSQEDESDTIAKSNGSNPLAGLLA